MFLQTEDEAGGMKDCDRAKAKNKEKRPYFQLNFSRKNNDTMTKTRSKPERRMKMVSDIIPVYSNISAKIPKKKDSSGGPENQLAGIDTMDRIAEIVKPNYISPLIEFGNIENQDVEPIYTREGNAKPFDSLGSYEPIQKQKKMNRHNHKHRSSLSEYGDIDEQNAEPTYEGTANKMPFDSHGSYNPNYRQQERKRHKPDYKWDSQLKPKRQRFDHTSGFDGTQEIQNDNHPRLQRTPKQSDQRVLVRLPPFETIKSSVRNNYDFPTNEGILLSSQTEQTNATVSMLVQSDNKIEQTSIFTQKVQHIGQIETQDGTSVHSFVEQKQLLYQHQYHLANMSDSLPGSIDEYLLHQRNKHK